MNYRIIPDKKKIIENEVRYLEQKHAQGYQLAEVGRLFYRFEPVAPEKVHYEIDLAAAELTDAELLIAEWQIMARKKISVSSLQKVYYCTRSASELAIDRRTRLAYYEKKISKYIYLMIATILPVLLAFIFIGSSFLPDFSGVAVVVCLLLFLGRGVSSESTNKVFWRMSH